MERSTEIMRTEALSIGYKSKKGNTVLLEGIDLQLKSGELIGLVGANGIGKSTLLRTLTKMQEPLAGNVYLNNTKLNEMSLQKMAQELSVVLTEPFQTKNLSVAELVSLGRQPYTNWIGTLSKQDRFHIHQAMDLVGILELKHRRCFELSDGQLQKVMIARALAQDTNMIVLDEPTTHLDMYHKAYILKLLRDLTTETGKTILFSTHEIDLAIQLCHSMLVMTNERVYSSDPCDLIEHKVFDNLFPQDLIGFDKHTGRFKIKK
jgi:iron complex transport system ATP-binding protein